MVKNFAFHHFSTLPPAQSRMNGNKENIAISLKIRKILETYYFFHSKKLCFNVENQVQRTSIRSSTLHLWDDPYVSKMNFLFRLRSLNYIYYIFVVFVTYFLISILGILSYSYSVWCIFSSTLITCLPRKYFGNFFLYFCANTHVMDYYSLSNHLDRTHYNDCM